MKEFWDDLKVDFLAFISDFHANGRLVRVSNCSFIVLIPKKENPRKIGDYRPISLIGCMYKVLAKLLANRLKRIIHLVISGSQSAFIADRHILDGILVANEVVDEAKRKKKETMLFKVDFEKAYDSVQWDYLDFVMQKMGFCTK